MSAGTTKVKICGLRTVPMVISLGTLEVDDIGFVFAPGKRTVTPELAASMIRALRMTGSGARTVGVFVNPSLEELAVILQSAPLDVVQLHGQEPPELCKQIKQQFKDIAVSKVFVAADDYGDTAAIARTLDPYRGVCDSIMLDTAGGGTGTTFDWECIPNYQAWAEEAGIPLMIAGGLNPGNVQELVKQYHPYGVDVSSGVETDGAKDIIKIKAFIERVKQHDQ